MDKICIPTCWAYFLDIYFDVVFRTLTAAATLTLKMKINKINKINKNKTKLNNISVC